MTELLRTWSAMLKSIANALTETGRGQSRRGIDDQ